MLVHDLVGSEPNTAVMDVEGEDMVDEGLAFRMVFRRVEYLEQHFFDESGMHGSFEVAIEGKEWTTVLEAIAGQLQFLGRVDV